MAETCGQMLNNAKLSLFLLVPGILFFLGGILILLQPTALVWLVGGTSILLGLLMFGKR
jgi:hypothetical protein